MKHQLFRTAKPVFVIAVLGIVLWVNAGDLNPPAGPVAPTSRFGPRVEIDSLPYTISASGSYYLGKNLAGVSGQNGITISVDDVTIDLGGFALIGVAGSLDGIVVAPQQGQHNITVKNGTVTGWGQDGLDLGAGNLIVARIHAYDNAGWGMHVNTISVVTECAVEDNDSGGIMGAHDGLIQNCTVSCNSGNGIQGGSGFTVMNCVISGNTGDGIYLQAATGDGKAAVSVTACTSRRNGGYGIKLTTSGLVKGCVANNNTSAGIEVGDGSTVAGCTATGNGQNGINAMQSATITGCTANGNNMDGINTQEGCTVAGCTSTSNNAYGIVSSNSLIAGNTVVNNAGGNCNTPGSTKITNHGCP